MNEQVTDYINQLSDKPAQVWQMDICTQLRQVIFEAIPDVEEKIQYGKPHYRKNGAYAAVIGTAKGWVSFTIFNAQDVQTPEGLFESSDDGSRKTIKILKGQEVDSDLLTKLVAQASSTL